MVQTRQQSKAGANSTSADSIQPSKTQNNPRVATVTRPKSKVSPTTTEKVSKTIPSGIGEENNLQGIRFFEIPHASSYIRCTLRPAEPPANSKAMIFTHSAGGDASTPSVANFVDAFAIAPYALNREPHVGTDKDLSSVVCFSGSMNLKSRTAMFQTVADYCAASDEFEGTPVFGGRSMGARAAVMAANAINSTQNTDCKIEKLVLVSYPLLGQNGEIRDQILLDIDKKVEVLFMIGSEDHMCDLEGLNKVRAKMAAKSWLVVVEDANHGMEAKPKSGSRELQLNTGYIAGRWAMDPSFYTTRKALGTMEGCEMMMNPPIVKGAAQGQTMSVSKGKAASKKRSLLEADEPGEEISNTKKKRGAKNT